MAILTVSRLYGSGGSEVAAIVAKTLGWSLLDNAVVDAVATRMGLSVAEVQAREERVPSLVERLTSAMAMGSQEWMSPIADTKRPTDEQLIEVTRHIIEEAIARELIRRAADATYQDRAGGINTDEIIMWFDVGGALQVTDDVPVDAVVEGFGSVPGLMQVVNTAGLAPMDDLPVVAAGCELVLESLVARKKIARSDAGQYGRAVEEKRRRPYQD